MDREKIRKIVTSQTRIFAEDNGYEFSEHQQESNVSKKFRSIMKKVETMYDGNDAMYMLFRDIVAEILDEPVNFAAEYQGSVIFTPNSLIVVLNNPNSHSYPIGEPVIVSYAREGKALMPNNDNRIGNNLPELKSSIRPATLKEINEWVEEVNLADDRIKAEFHYLEIVKESEKEKSENQEEEELINGRHIDLDEEEKED